MNDTKTIAAYVGYLLTTIPVAIWVGRTLSANGAEFLKDSFHGNEGLSQSVNKLLVVGFYLINIGFIAVTMNGNEMTSWVQALQWCTKKFGMVLLVLGIMHFFNIYVFSRFRRRARLEQMAPPVLPDTQLPPQTV